MLVVWHLMDVTPQDITHVRQTIATYSFYISRGFEEVNWVTKEKEERNQWKNEPLTPTYSTMFTPTLPSSCLWVPHHQSVLYCSRKAHGCIVQDHKWNGFCDFVSEKPHLLQKCWCSGAPVFFVLFFSSQTCMRPLQPIMLISPSSHDVAQNNNNTERRGLNISKT